MTTTTHRAIVILFVLALARIATAQSVDFAPLDAVVTTELGERRVPGAAVAIVSDGHVVYAKGFGVANVEAGTPMTAEHLIRLGSTTKMFTAAALLALADKGRVDLQKPIGTYIKSLDPAVGRLTSHQLLSHTSGLLDEAPMYGSDDEAALMTNVLTWKADRFFTEPGAVYSYSNPGYWLAGAVIEAVSGKRYADELNDAIFKLAGMTHTTLRPTVAMTYPLALGHDVVENKPVVVRPFANNAMTWPAGSIFSSVMDLSRFVIAFVGGGSIDGKQVLAPSVLAALSTAKTEVPGSESSYSYGLSIAERNGVRVISHGGSRSGYGSMIGMVPARRFGVIIVGNRSGASFPRTMATAMELGIGLKPAAPVTTTMPPMTEKEMAAYAGIYSQGRRKLEVVQRGGKLYLKGQGEEAELRRIGEHRFTSNLYFVVGSDGRAAYVHSGGRSWRRMSN